MQTAKAFGDLRKYVQYQFVWNPVILIW